MSCFRNKSSQCLFNTQEHPPTLSPCSNARMCLQWASLHFRSRGRMLPKLWFPLEIPGDIVTAPQRCEWRHPRHHIPLCHLLSNTDNFIENPKEKRSQPLGHSRAVLFHCRQGLRCGTVWRTLYSLHLIFTCFPAAPTDFVSHFWRFHIRSSWWISLHSSWPVWLPTTFNDSEKYCNEHLYKCRLSLFKNDTRWFTRGKKNWPA